MAVNYIASTRLASTTESPSPKKKKQKQKQRKRGRGLIKLCKDKTTIATVRTISHNIPSILITGLQACIHIHYQNKTINILHYVLILPLYTINIHPFFL